MSSPTRAPRTVAATVVVLVVSLLALASCSNGSNGSSESDADRNAASYRGTEATLVNAGSQPITVIAGGHSTDYRDYRTTVLEPGATVTASEAGGNFFGGSVDAVIYWGTPTSQVLSMTMKNEPVRSYISIWHQNAPFDYFNDGTNRPNERADYNVVVDPQPDYHGTWKQEFGDRTLIVERNGWNDEYYLWTITFW